MRILITNERLDQRAGSDGFVRDLARGLQALGHYVIVYGSDQHQRPRFLERDSIPVAADLERLPFRPDIIHARHHLDAMTAVSGLPGVPAIHHCIAPASSIVLPVHPRIHRYVAPSTDVAGRLAGEGIGEERIDLVGNAVDLQRFARRREPATPPRRVLVYDDELGADSPVVSAIRAAAAARGLSLDHLGRRFGRVIDNPELRLLDYDIVCARGRKAIEALACGCAVMIIAHDRGERLVDRLDVARLRDTDFSVGADAPVASADRLAAAFAGYAPESAAAATAEVRSACDFPRLASELEAVYRSAIAMHQGDVADPARYLEKLLPSIKRMEKAQTMAGDVPLSTASMLLGASASLAAIQADLDKPR